MLRLKRGDRLVVFNGRGTERDASVEALQRRGATLDARRRRARRCPSRALDLTLVQALPKSDAMDLIVQKATELGVRTLVPVYTEFSVVKLDTERSERRVDHWRKIARSACEQCGRHTPPRDRAGRRRWPTALEALPAAPRAARARSVARSRASPSEQRRASGLVVAVGPEGGFGATDWRRLDAAGFARVTLGPRVLRAETAALAGLRDRAGALGRPARLERAVGPL